MAEFAAKEVLGASYPLAEFWELQQRGTFSDISIFSEGRVLKSHRLFVQLWLPWLHESADALILPHTSAHRLEAALQRLYLHLDPVPAQKLLLDPPSAFSTEPEDTAVEEVLEKLEESDVREIDEDVDRTRDFFDKKCDRAVSTRSRKGTLANSSRWPDRGPFRCPECGKMLATQSTLRDHLRWHEGVPRVPCRVCGKLLANGESLRKHVRALHDKVKPHSCEHCDYTAMLPGELQQHIESVHLGIRHECEICGQLLATRSSLSTHKQRHSAHTLFVCTECGHGYRRKTHLERHTLRKHSQQEYQCPECGKLLKSKDGLDYHMKYHNPANQLPCSYCGRRFVTKRKLAFHINTHTGERPFKCINSGCGKAFPASDQLSHHKKTCSGRQ